MGKEVFFIIAVSQKHLGRTASELWSPAWESMEKLGLQHGILQYKHIFHNIMRGHTAYVNVYLQKNFQIFNHEQNNF
jgi:hypothetical protein